MGTEEFISKNIRVRPISGLTQADKDEKQSEMYGGRQQLMDMGHSLMDEEEKFNTNVIMDMEDAWKKVKQDKKNYEQEQIRLAEKAAK